MRLTILLSAAAAMFVAACGGDGGGGAGGSAASSGAGGAAVSSATSSSIGASSGGGSGGEGGSSDGVVSASIATLAGCARPRIVGPFLPEEADVIALGRFTFAELTVTLDSFSYVAEPERGQCADVVTEVVYFASGDERPPESPDPGDVHAVAVPPSGGGEVVVTLDPPLALTSARPFAFVGVRMAAVDDESICIVGCPASEAPDANWWSSAPSAPFGWDRLVDSSPGDEPSTPDDGLAWDYVFSVSGRTTP